MSLPTNHFNGLTEAEAERLALLVEECGEAIQAAIKILRHGFESSDPTTPERSSTNRKDLAKEVGHVQAAIALCIRAGDFPESDSNASWNEKAANVRRWLHHQRY